MVLITKNKAEEEMVGGRKMKRKYFILMLGMSLVLSISGCDLRQKAGMENKAIESAENKIEEDIKEELDYEWEWVIDPRESEYKAINMVNKDCFIISQEGEDGENRRGIIDGEGEFIVPIGELEEDYDYEDELITEENFTDCSAENGGRIDSTSANGWCFEWVQKNGGSGAPLEKIPDSLRNKVEGEYLFLSGGDIALPQSAGGSRMRYIDALNLELGVLATEAEIHKVALCDKNGNIYMEPGVYSFNKKHEKSYNCVFCDGRLPVREGKTGNYGYIDVTGEEVISAIYDFAGPFQEGLAFVRPTTRGIPAKYIDVNGNNVIYLEGLENCVGGPFRDGYAIVGCMMEDEEGVLTQRRGLLKCNTEIFDVTDHLKKEYKKYQEIVK